MKQRNIGIDILKCFAAIVITNSHMDILYPKFGALATGGAIGDALFFFSSGFTLFLGRMGRFDNWYKRRINRIYPTVFAWAILGSLLFGYYNDINNILLSGGRWFVSCIMLYYVLLYFIQRYLLEYLKLVFMIVMIACSLFTDKMNAIFPFNLIVMFAIIVFAAYILRCGARLFAQTFLNMDYDWKAVFKAV